MLYEVDLMQGMEGAGEGMEGAGDGKEASLVEVGVAEEKVGAGVGGMEG
jgi:hypothetical protein